MTRGDEKRYGIEAVIDQSPAMQRALAQARAEGWRAGAEDMRERAATVAHDLSGHRVADPIRALPLEPGAS
jgi:hypothetical protein